MDMIMIIKYEHNLYNVRCICSETVVSYETLDMALNLCRIRLDKCRASEFDPEPLSILKVPFIKTWIV